MKYVLKVYTTIHQRIVLRQITNIWEFFLIMINKIKTSDFIFKRKYFALLCLPLNVILSLSDKELCKLNRLIVSVNIYELLIIIKYIPINRITKHNVHDFYLFVSDMNMFIDNTKPIKWGRGNHLDVEENINQHYIKHVEEFNCSIYEYIRFPIDNFYSMKKAVVHSNGKGVYLSGFVGNIFIVGRYGEETFGISSCYYVKSGEKNGRYNDLCMEIKI